jgi:hypothetical protein
MRKLWIATSQLSKFCNGSQVLSWSEYSTHLTKYSIFPFEILSSSRRSIRNLLSLSINIGSGDFSPIFSHVRFQKVYIKGIVQSFILIWQFQFINVVINFFGYFKRIQITIRQFFIKFSHTNILYGQKYFIVKFKSYFYDIIVLLCNFLYSNLENFIRSVVYILYFDLLSYCGCLFRNIVIRSSGIYTKRKFKSIDYVKRNFSDYSVNAIIKFILRWRE